MIDIFEDRLHFFYKTLQEEKRLYSKLGGVFKQITGVRINLLIGTVDITEAALRTLKRQQYDFGVKLSARAVILHMHEMTDTAGEFESQIFQISKFVGFDPEEYRKKVDEFNKTNRKRGLGDIREMNKLRDIYGHSDPDWEKVINMVDGIDVKRINELAVLSIGCREILIEWTSVIKNFLTEKMSEMKCDVEINKLDHMTMIEKYAPLLRLLKDEVTLSPVNRSSDSKKSKKKRS